MDNKNELKYAKKMLFLGGLFPKETEKEIIENSLGGVQNAANVLQEHLVSGFDSNLIFPVKIINALYIGAYPKRYKQWKIKTYQFSHTEGAKDVNVGFTNLPLWKHFSRGLRLRPYLKRWAKENDGGAVVAYALTLTNVRSLIYIKKVNPTVKTCIVVPDLPMYMNTGTQKSLLYSMLKRSESKLIQNSVHNIDCFVLLTKQMNEFVHAKEFCVVEGIATECPLQEKKASKTKNILYTGTLNEKYGVINLVHAFEMIEDENYRLIVCGKGDSEEEIKSMAEKDPRILFMGQVNRNDALRYQSEATVLVNPRQNIEAFTRFSFPSKNIEYLSSGTPLIAYKLDGIPDEYDSYISYVKDNSIKSLMDKLTEICEMTQEDRALMGMRAREFVLKEKKAKVQCSRILEML